MKLPPETLSRFLADCTQNLNGNSYTYQLFPTGGGILSEYQLGFFHLPGAVSLLSSVFY